MIKFRNKISLAIVVLTLIFSGIAMAGDMTVITTYRQIKEISLPKLIIPKVVEIPFDASGLERSDFLVLDKTTGDFQPSLLIKNKISDVVSSTVVTADPSSSVGSPESLTDNNDQTYTEIALPNSGMGQTRVILESENIINTDSIYILLDNYVALPKTVAVYTGDDSSLKTVLASKVMDSQVVHFPKVSSKRFVVDLTYGQPLRITEIRFGGQVYNQKENSKLRFLAQPDHQYEVYFNPDRRVSAPIGEMGNLYDNEGLLVLPASPDVDNKSYTAADSDGDGIIDIRDNCVRVSNLDQKDIDNNGRGDVCDDFDKDGVINSVDNCPDQPNYNQSDVDADKIGDVCDGAESRITEKYSWLPWLGMGLAALVVIGLFILTAMSMRKKPEVDIVSEKTDIASK